MRIRFEVDSIFFKALIFGKTVNIKYQISVVFSLKLQNAVYILFTLYTSLLFLFYFTHVYLGLDYMAKKIKIKNLISVDINKYHDKHQTVIDV